MGKSQEASSSGPADRRTFLRTASRAALGAVIGVAAGVKGLKNPTEVAAACGQWYCRYSHICYRASGGCVREYFYTDTDWLSRCNGNPCRGDGYTYEDVWTCADYQAPQCFFY